MVWTDPRVGTSRVVDGPGTGVGGRDVGRARRVALGPTRISWTWVALVVGVLLGVALVDFLVENTRSTEIAFFSVSGHVPLTAALLVAALAGASVVLVVGGARLVQLRRGVRAMAAGVEPPGAERPAVPHPVDGPGLPGEPVGRADRDG